MCAFRFRVCGFGSGGSGDYGFGFFGREGMRVSGMVSLRADAPVRLGQGDEPIDKKRDGLIPMQRTLQSAQECVLAPKRRGQDMRFTCLFFFLFGGGGR